MPGAGVAMAADGVEGRPSRAGERIVRGPSLVCGAAGAGTVAVAIGPRGSAAPEPAADVAGGAATPGMATGAPGTTGAAFARATAGADGAAGAAR